MGGGGGGSYLVSRFLCNVCITIDQLLCYCLIDKSKSDPHVTHNEQPVVLLLASWIAFMLLLVLFSFLSSKHML